MADFQQQKQGKEQKCKQKQHPPKRKNNYQILTQI